METDTYKQRLEEDLAQIKADLLGIASYNEATGDWEAKAGSPAESADENLTADAAEDGIERQGEVAALETRFRNISRALKKIENGTYGVCEISGTPIEAERLDANPAARTCIADRERETELPL